MKKIRICLDELLEKSDLNRFSLSKKSGVSYQVITRYYKNQTHKYDADTLVKLCIALECGIGDLIKIEEE